MTVTWWKYRNALQLVMLCIVTTSVAQDNTNQRLITFPFEGTGIERPQDMLLDEYGYLWLLDSEHLYCLLSDGFEQVAPIPPDLGAPLQLEKIGNGSAWVSTAQGEVIIPVGEALMDPEASISSEPVNAESVILFTDEYEQDVQPASGSVRAARKLEDPANGTWTLSRNKLELISDDDRMIGVRHFPSVTGNISQVWEQTEKNRTWLSTSAGIVIVDTRTDSVIHVIDRTIDNAPVSGISWVQCAGMFFTMSTTGLYQINIDEFTAELVLSYEEISKDQRIAFNTLDSDPKGDMLIIGTKRSLVIFFDPRARSFQQVSIDPDADGRGRSIIYQVDQIDTNKVLVLAGRSFYLVDIPSMQSQRAEDTWKGLRLPEEVKPSGVQVIGDSLLFISSFNDGFFGFSIARDELIRPQGPLFDDRIITDVFWDRAEHVYAPSNGGLLVYHIPSRTVRSIGTGQGLPQEDLYYKYMNVQRPGVINMGIGKRTLTFRSEALESSKDPPLFVERLDVNGDRRRNVPLVLGSKIDLGHLERSCAIHLGSPVRTLPRSAGSYVKLSGQTSDAVYYGPDEVIRFHALPLGTNEILIGTAQGDLRSLITFEVAPPFWRTWWFIGSVLAFLFAVVWVSYRQRVRAIEERLALKAEYDTRISKLELNALRAQMHPHFIFNSLNSIKSFIADNEPRSATRYLNKFSQLIRAILNNSRHERVDLRSEVKALQLYIELEQMRFTKQFDARINVADDIDQDEVGIPPMIFQPFAENAIWHGFMQKDGPCELTVDIVQEGKMLVATIRDNGIGRAASAKLKSATETKHRSLGMKITSELIERTHTGGQKGVVINDLHDEEGKACGTEVIVYIPIEQSA